MENNCSENRFHANVNDDLEPFVYVGMKGEVADSDKCQQECVKAVEVARDIMRGVLYV